MIARVCQPKGTPMICPNQPAPVHATMMFYVAEHVRESISLRMAEKHTFPVTLTAE